MLGLLNKSLVWSDIFSLLSKGYDRTTDSSFPKVPSIQQRPPQPFKYYKDDFQNHYNGRSDKIHKPKSINDFVRRNIDL